MRPKAVKAAYKAWKEATARSQSDAGVGSRGSSSYQREEGQPVLGIEMSQDKSMCKGTERDGYDAEHEKRNEGTL